MNCAPRDAVARLDERFATSPIAAAFCARAHIHDAAAAIFLEGELVHLEDLVLHDAAADIHAPTHALTRAHAALRARRRIAAAAPGWAASEPALDAVRGLPSRPDTPEPPPLADPIAVEKDALAAELAALDALLARTTKILEARSAPQSHPPPPPTTSVDKDLLAA